MPHRRLVFPAPSVVIGMGRFGLAVLERLGEDWHQLRLAGADLSLNNLRLLHVHPGEVPESEWRRKELRELRIASHIKDGDWPSVVLDFVILRTLGLIRFRHGTYQVAVPRDRGAIRVKDLLGSLPDSESQGERSSETPPETEERRKEEEQYVRRRFFEWQSLSSDPLRAAEELQRQAEDRSSLHLFIKPIINRIRQGHSPKVLLSVILRCSSLAEGRDPTPWRWLRTLAAKEPTPDSSEWAVSLGTIEVTRDHRRNDQLLDDLADPPGPLHQMQGSNGADEYQELRLPNTFFPRSADPEAPIDPFHLLGEDWEATGWATDLSDEERAFRALKVSHFRLGLFDHSPGHEAQELAKGFRSRLKTLADFLHRGLVRLWVDLGRDQVEEHVPTSISRRRFLSEEALQQSLAMLEELLVEPLKNEERNPKDSELPKIPIGQVESPTRFLRSLTLKPDPQSQSEEALERRLADLGLRDPERPLSPPRPLMHDVVLSLPMVEGDEEFDPGRRCLRKVLNRETRQLLDFSFLAAYRKRPTRTPPRLTVFVVGDMAEPFTRLKTTEVLQEIHSELLRSFSSMFELHREGFDRALSVVPILAMPHPADPFGGEPLEQTRLEEAVIIDAVHKVRHWVESVLPGARRRISQIFIGGRVTDNAVLKPKDMVLQTRDFLSFLMRNDLSRDEWLRRAAVGPGGDDFFASFACSEIEFPAEKAREYLANRLVRDCLHQLRTASRWQGPEVIRVPQAATEDMLVADAVEGIGGQARDAANRLAGQVREALSAAINLRCVPQHIVLSSFDERLERRLWTGVSRLWAQLTQDRGRVDELVDKLRHQVSSELRAALPEIRREADSQIEGVSRNGLLAVLDRFAERRRSALTELQLAEESRRDWEAHCERHRRPRRQRLAQARHAVVERALRKPDCEPIRVGLWGCLLVSPAAGSLFAAWIAPWTGAVVASLLSCLVVVVVAAGSLWYHSRRTGKLLRDSIVALECTTFELIAGKDEPSLADQDPSLRSFFEMRLRLTGALARRSYALHTFEQAAVDDALGRRLVESVDIQEHTMIRHAEKLGVRPAPPGEDARDDLRRLFVGRTGDTVDKLINPEQLVELYRGRHRQDDLPLTDFLQIAGGLDEWRRSACLSCTDAVLNFGRTSFDFIAVSPIAELDYFSQSVGDQLRGFVQRYYSNIGFGAKFLGYEGLDPDGLRLAIDAGLIADKALIDTYLQAEERAELQAEESRQPYSRPRTLECRAYRVRPNAAYMMSLVQGVRPHSIHNLKRFESFHDRGDEPKGSQPVGQWTGYAICGEELLKKIRSCEPPGRPKVNGKDKPGEARKGGADGTS